MAYEPKPGSFSLFKNDKKESENHPDYKGDGLDIDGRPIWVSAWIKQGAKGKFMSCAFKIKEPKPAGNTDHGKAKANAYQADDLDDRADLPF